MHAHILTGNKHIWTHAHRKERHRDSDRRMDAYRQGQKWTGTAYHEQTEQAGGTEADRATQTGGDIQTLTGTHNRITRSAPNRRNNDTHARIASVCLRAFRRAQPKAICVEPKPSNP